MKYYQLFTGWKRFHAKFLESKKLKFVRLLNHYFPNRFCWTDCVAWSYNSESFNPFSIDRPIGCRIDSQKNEACYCGQFVKGKCWSELSESQKEELRRD
jgi:hypothetical protein